MVALIKIVVQLIADVARLVILRFRPLQSVQAENLFLRRQLSLFKEHDIKLRRVDAATRISLAVLARFFEWRVALIAVQPKTIIRWQRAGWRLFWRRKCRPGRPRIPVELRALIRRLAQENSLWGEERIVGETGHSSFITEGAEVHAEAASGAATGRPTLAHIPE